VAIYGLEKVLINYFEISQMDSGYPCRGIFMYSSHRTVVGAPNLFLAGSLAASSDDTRVVVLQSGVRITSLLQTCPRLNLRKFWNMLKDQKWVKSILIIFPNKSV
jgi:hypothetical protein